MKIEQMLKKQIIPYLFCVAWKFKIKLIRQLLQTFVFNSTNKLITERSKILFSENETSLVK